MSINKDNNNNIKNNNNNSNNNKSYTNNQKKFKDLIKKIKDNNLTINTADKGNIIVIENKDQLKEKINNFLDNDNFEKLKSDPTLRFQNKIKEHMKKSTKLIQPQVLNKMINPNPKAPTLRTNTKIHKIKNPVRPIVNYTQAPAYKIKKIS